MGGKRKKHKPRFKPIQNKVKPSEVDLLVFISSLIDKMPKERDAVDRAMDSIPITRSWRFEHTPASSQPIEESYLSHVRTCDIFVLVLGHDYSDAVTREYQTAVETRRPILAFVQGGEKNEKQNEFIHSLNVKYATYADAGELEVLVARSIWDELIRSHRNSIPPSEAPKLIESLPVAVRKPEDISGYVIIGLEDAEVGKILFEPFGGETPPQDLKELNPSMEPVSFDNLSEMQEAFVGLKNAATRSSTATGDRQKAYLRELKREASEIASRYIIRQKNKQPEPQITIPGLKYFIWGMAPDIARIMRVMRPKELVGHLT